MAKCAHCGTRARKAYSWDLRVCSDGRRKRVRWLCPPCDVALNALVLAFFNDPAAGAKMAAYTAKVEQETAT